MSKFSDLFAAAMDEARENGTVAENTVNGSRVILNGVNVAPGTSVTCVSGDGTSTVVFNGEVRS